MTDYYRRAVYHDGWIKGINTHLIEKSHPAQVKMCALIPAGSAVLEVGCGDGSAAIEIAQRTRNITYTGLDLNSNAWRETKGFEFHVGSATDLPFANESFDVVLSMFAVEHLVFPNRFLEQAWRVLRPRGRLLLIAPDFARSAMPSERIGLSYGCGSTKLRQGRILDALLTAYDTRIRMKRWMTRRMQNLERGLASFPVLVEPRCFSLPGFTPDCDAVYPACPEEIALYLQQTVRLGNLQIFHRDQCAFGLLAEKL